LFALAGRDAVVVCGAPEWADTRARGARGAGNCYFASYETPAVILYAEQAVTAQQAPADWDDLLAPQWRGKVIIRDPLASGTMRAFFGLIVSRSIQQHGDTGPGFAWLRRLDAQTKEYVQNPSLVSEKIARQEGLLTVWDLPDVMITRSRGLPVGYVFPKSGTVAIEDAIGVVRGSKHVAAARAFVDFVGSVPMQLAAAREVYRLPARLDLPADSLPAWVRDVRRQMVVADVDWNLLATRGPEWMSWWDQHVRGKGK
jgi:iron(III) transport system substrate-binding protein